MNNYIRITSGLYKGRKILTPGGATHPMGERERIALFNMISGFIPGARILDTFSGSGALGIEALSRGAEEAVFIEKNPRAAKVIRENLEEIGESSRGKVLLENVYQYLEKSAEKWDIVIADPPYDLFDRGRIQILAGKVEESGILVLSHPGEAPEMPGLKLDRTKSYAGANISIYLK